MGKFLTIFFLPAVWVIHASAFTVPEYPAWEFSQNSTYNPDTYKYECDGVSARFAGLAKDVTVPDSVTYQGVTYPVVCFAGFSGPNSENQKKSVRNVVFPDGVESIGSWAFSNCRSLKSVVLPKSLKTLGSYAFYSSGIESIEIPEGVTMIDGYTFGGCRNLKDVKIRGVVKTVACYAFWGCNVETLEFKDGLESIGEHALGSIKNPVLPQSVKRIEAGNLYSSKTLKGYVPSPNI